MDDVKLVFSGDIGFETLVELQKRLSEYSDIRLNEKQMYMLYCLSGGKPRYGLEMQKILWNVCNVDISSSALYPLLKQLEDYKLVDTFWVEDKTMKRGGRNKKMYQINQKGKELLAIEKTKIIALQECDSS